MGSDELTGAGPDSLAFLPAARDLTGVTMGDFEVQRRLGQGGMGEVYLARQISLNRSVALKVLRPELLANPTYAARFEAEAYAAAKLNHPNIVHIYSLGEVEGTRFIAMEYVQGTNLRELMQKRGTPELIQCLSIMKQAGLGVGAAGEDGLIHRDIKPENLLLTRKGQVKVADFGLCRPSDAESHHLTQTGTTLGTPMYMSPEQVQGLAVDHRSDLYSLGVTFYHMLAGEPPFRAESSLALALKHVRDKPTSLAVHRPDLPADLVALVMKLIEKDPAKRYQSAAEMLKELAKVRSAINAPSVAISTTEARSALAVEPTEAISRPSVAFRMPEVQIGGGTIAAVAAAGLLLGAALGWLARAEDLLGEAPSTARGKDFKAGLWMEDWARVRRQPTAAAQYRYAQTGAPEADRAAAWLAVPGYHRTADEYASRAYIQLARLMLRRGDAAGLVALAEELPRMDREHDKQIANVSLAGARALGDDPAEVAAKLDPMRLDGEPALAELALEVVLTALRRPAVEGLEPARLNALRMRLLTALHLDVVVDKLKLYEVR